MMGDFIGRQELAGDLKLLTDGMDDDRRSLAKRGDDLDRLFEGTFIKETFPLRRAVAEACFRLSLDLIRSEAIPAADLEPRSRRWTDLSDPVPENVDRRTAGGAARP